MAGKRLSENYCRWDFRNHDGYQSTTKSTGRIKVLFVTQVRIDFGLKRPNIYVLGSIITHLSSNVSGLLQNVHFYERKNEILEQHQTVFSHSRNEHFALF